MAGMIRAARLEPGQWTLLAESKVSFAIAMRTIGIVLIQRADEVPASPPNPDAADTDDAFHYGTVWSGQPRSGSYADAKNIYGFNPGNSVVVIEFEVE